MTGQEPFGAPILSDDYLKLIDALWVHYTQHGDVTLERQVIKIQEEVGEVAAALIGALGANPRKGFTHTASDVAAELADVVITAVLAIKMCRKDPNEELKRQVLETQGRLDEYNSRE